MKQTDTTFGVVRIGTIEEIFNRQAELLEEAAAQAEETFTVGLTGGSTPKAFYEWVTENKKLSDAVLEKATWCVSDERMVPLADPESNFGNADRNLLTPLNVTHEHKLPWPVQVDPHSSALVFERRFHERFGPNNAFDLCFLGMGEDGHTASIFPGSPLLFIQSGDHFAPVDVPEKGWRLSITPDGLKACGKIVVTVTGAPKLHRLKKVLQGPKDDLYPIQILSRMAEKVEWLVDEAAGDLLVF